mgnify:CR=1 FL=1
MNLLINLYIKDMIDLIGLEKHLKETPLDELKKEWVEICKLFPNNIKIITHTIYEFLYNPCIYESGYITISLHITKEGAIKAMKAHKAKEKRKFNKLFTADKLADPAYQNIKFGMHEDWKINETIILN